MLLATTPARRPRLLAWLAAAVLIGGSVAVAVRALDVRPVRITSSSMSPTVKRGDWIVVGQKRIHRGDVVMFRFPLGTDGRAIKRVVALAGDRVSIAARTVTVNGRAIPIAGAPGANARRRRTTTVPAGHVFVLGDNAAVSIDSRSFGPLPEREIVGRELIVIGGTGRLIVPAILVAGLLALAMLLVARRRYAAGRSAAGSGRP